jgi:glutamine synthetase
VTCWSKPGLQEAETRLVTQTKSHPHPPSLSDALPDPERVAETQGSLKQAGVRYVFSCWIDLLGLPKTKPVGIEEFEALCRGKGPQFAAHSVSMVPELGPADPDQIAVPDLDSLMICPWDERIAWVFADLFWEGEPYNVCPRSALKRQVSLAAEAGYHVHAGFEPEFVVMREVDGRVEKAFGVDALTIDGQPLRRQAYGYDAEHSLDGLPFLQEVMEALGRLGWGLSNVVCEGAYSQFELDYGYSDAIGAADRLCFLRVLLKEIAKRHGLFVTYMAKPTDGDWRSGAHINHSLTPVGDHGTNLFSAGNGDWGDPIYPVIAGVMKHGEALTALACPTVNSYKALIGRNSALEGGTLTWAPTHIAYGHNNRSAMLRLPQTRRALENRACDMSVNPYLALAMTIGASLEGLEQGLEAGDPVDKPMYDLTEDEVRAAGIRQLPTTLIEAIEAFDADPLAQEVLGPTMHSAYSRYKHDEWRRFHNHVTAWEQAEYLKFF